MTSITPKLTAVITTIAMLAPVAGAQAASHRALHPARHFASSHPRRHFTPQHPRRSPAKFQPDSRAI